MAYDLLEGAFVSFQIANILSRSRPIDIVKQEGKSTIKLPSPWNTPAFSELQEGALNSNMPVHALALAASGKFSFYALNVYNLQSRNDENRDDHTNSSELCNILKLGKVGVLLTN